MTTEAIRASGPDLSSLISNTPPNELGKIFSALKQTPEGKKILSDIANHPEASDAVKALVDSLLDVQPLTKPRDPRNQPIADVIREIQGAIFNEVKDGAISGFVARFSDAKISPDNKSIGLFPKGYGPSVGGLEGLSTSTREGFFDYTVNGKFGFGWGRVLKTSLYDLVQQNCADKRKALATLADHMPTEGWLQKQTTVLAVETDDPRDPVIYLAAIPRASDGSAQDDYRMAVICKGCKVDRIDPVTGRFIGGPGGLEKPVVYFYPEQRASLDVTVDVKGKFTAQYPKPVEGDSTWRFIAETDGTLLDPRSGRRHSYLYWEADPSFPMAIDNAKAHLIKGSDAQTFLERVSAAYAFNDRETTDFVSYWVGRMERHPYCMVQLLEDDVYESYAKMTVVPTPTTVNRLFMVIRGTAEVTPVGAPALPIKERKGFTVVEWGGAEI